MSFSKAIIGVMMLITLSILVYSGSYVIEKNNKITGFANNPEICIGDLCPNPGSIYCGDGICNGAETPSTCLSDCRPPSCPNPPCESEQSQEPGDVLPDGDDDLLGLEPTCSDGTVNGQCSLTEFGKKCVIQGNRVNLVGACNECACQPGYMCDTGAQECLPAHTCEEASALCLLGPECPGNTTSLPQFNRHCNLVSVGIPKPTYIPKICCWPNQEYLNSLGGGSFNTSELVTYSDVREQLGICLDLSHRDSCSSDGLFCNENLQLVQDCTKCGCAQGLLCYQKQCVTPEEYDKLAFFGDILQFNRIERILVLNSQNKVYDISSAYSPGEYAQAFSPLYSGAQDVVPSFSPSTTPDNKILLSAVVPERDNDKFEIEVGLRENKIPSIKINLNS